MIMISKLKIGEPASFRSKLSFILLESSHPAQERNSISKTKFPKGEISTTRTIKRASMESTRRGKSMKATTTPTLRAKTTTARHHILSTTVVVALTTRHLLRMTKSSSPSIRRRTRKQRRSMVEVGTRISSGKMIRRLHSLPS